MRTRTYVLTYVHTYVCMYKLVFSMLQCYNDTYVQHAYVHAYVCIHSTHIRTCVYAFMSANRSTYMPIYRAFDFSCCSEPLPLEVEMRRVKPDLTSPRRQKSLSQQTSFNPRVRTHPLNLLPLSPDATSSIFHEVDAATWYTVSTRDFGKLGTGMGESAISWQFGRHLLDKPPVSSVYMYIYVRMYVCTYLNQL